MHVAVIGSGAAGMGAALMLARHGCRVTLFEAKKQIAPLLRGFRRKGHQFDTGFHCAGTLGPSGALSRYLRMAGVYDRLNLKPMREDCIELFRFSGGQSRDICLPQGIEQAIDVLAVVWPEHKNDLATFFKEVKEGFNHSPFTNPASMKLDFSALQGGASALEYLARFNMPERLKSILFAHSVFMGIMPEEASMGEFSLVSYSMFEDMCHIEGGGAALVKAFEAELESAGVEVVTSKAVIGFSVDQGRVKSVRCADGTEVTVDHCVYTGHPGRLPEMLPQGALRPSMLRHLNDLRDTEYCFTVFGTSKSNFLDGRFVYHAGSDLIKDAFTAFKTDKSWMTLSTTEPNSDGYYPIVANVNLLGGMHSLLGEEKSDKRPADYYNLKKEYESWTADRIRRCFPELSDFEVVCSATDVTMRDWVYGSTGSLYGVIHSLGQMPVLPRTKIDNLVLAGQGIILPGLLGVLVSAAVASGFIIGFEKISEDFRNA